MVEHLLGHHHVPQPQVVGQVAGNAGVEQGVHPVAVTEDLGADGGVYLADAAASQHHLLSSQLAREVGAAGHHLLLQVFQVGPNEGDLLFHCADDPDGLHLSSPPVLRPVGVCLVWKLYHIRLHIGTPNRPY